MQTVGGKIMLLDPESSICLQLDLGDSVITAEIGMVCFVASYIPWTPDTFLNWSPPISPPLFSVYNRANSSLASHTLRRERKGLVTLQPSSCPHNKILLWPIRSMLFVDRIRCHGVQLYHNVFSGCQHLITKPLCSVIAFLGNNSVVAAWPDPSSLCEGYGLRD